MVPRSIATDPKLREKAEHINVLVYARPALCPSEVRPAEDVSRDQPKGEKLLEFAKTLRGPFTRPSGRAGTGEKVVHLSPYGARGIEGMETAEGHALLCEIWGDVERTLQPYYHQWKLTDMLIWDNWRMLHMACGCDPACDRVMHRTTIKGDYGLGRWETAPTGAVATPEMT